MASKQKPLKPLNKSNSPVTRTGQGNTVKNRLLKAKEEGLIKGREKILLAARACFAKQGFAGTSKGIAQERLGLESGVDRTLVSKIERQIANPSLEILSKIAAYLEVSVIELLTKKK
jgi:DNA-binding XRE family transcriptional regulator